MDVRDCIEALVRQESRYCFHNYVERSRDHEVSSPSSSSTDLVLMVEEFANVVTDKHLAAPCGNPISKSTSMKDVRDVDTVLQSAPPQALRVPESFRFYRQQMFDWACMVVDSFGMDREIVAVSFGLLDAYMSNEVNSPEEVTREDFQLFSMTCLYLAIKVLEPYPRKIGMEALVDMSRGFYTTEDIAVTERDILTSLGWRLNAPTALSFTRLFWSLFPGEVSASAQLTSTTLTEISVSDSFFIARKSSLIGLAAVVIAARLHGISDQEVQQFLSTIEGIISIRGNAEFIDLYNQLEVLYA